MRGGIFTAKSNSAKFFKISRGSQYDRILEGDPASGESNWTDVISCLSHWYSLDFSKRTDKGSYILGESSCFLGIEVWAFELKLKDPKRAIFQAQQSRSYAEYSIIVVPPGQERNQGLYGPNFPGLLPQQIGIFRSLTKWMISV